ncbi:S phase kinase associated protein SKR 1 [Echinococcus multilocularis]|uniref:S phase kinase associated protein SKR 1 n=1 Tax=Echinococcus multilocularis TaxID=6211 RepID=A0A0S4MK23_ECHMU|nr:S phase kinase associated protein SKR 1 [Echinococcus multilocularis]
MDRTAWPRYFYAEKISLHRFTQLLDFSETKISAQVPSGCTSAARPWVQVLNPPLRLWVTECSVLELPLGAIASGSCRVNKRIFWLKNQSYFGKYLDLFNLDLFLCIKTPIQGEIGRAGAPPLHVRWAAWPLGRVGSPKSFCTSAIDALPECQVYSRLWESL